MRFVLPAVLLTLGGCGDERGFTLGGGGDERGFDIEAWKASAVCGERSNPRYAMRAAAQAQLKQGMPKRQVEQILGPPDETRDGESLYCLGMYSGAGVDEDVLHVAFDEKGGLSWTAVIQH